MKFFFEATLKRDWTAMDIPRPRAEHKSLVVLSRAEVRAILGSLGRARLIAYCNGCPLPLTCLARPLPRSKTSCCEAGEVKDWTDN